MVVHLSTRGNCRGVSFCHRPAAGAPVTAINIQREQAIASKRPRIDNPIGGCGFSSSGSGGMVTTTQLHIVEGQRGGESGDWHVLACLGTELKTWERNAGFFLVASKSNTRRRLIHSKRFRGA
ncbi:hypothetical protein EJB05_13768 [Eragrostis curvula]|uniref:Uncharacterized protein n=1 Tax=Eragrostis curvula TaxID=38414 RepID=A0A5J9VYZ3_9POAL|nr:hypothetical protein EJB05_13768 [Eragrostis curvula]